MEVEGKCEVRRFNVCRGGEVDTYPGTLMLMINTPRFMSERAPHSRHVIRRARFFDVSDADAVIDRYKTSM
jgi:hypothetical protein